LKNGSLLIKNVFNNDEKDISEGLEAYQCVAFVDNIGSAVSRIATITLARKFNSMEFLYLFINYLLLIIKQDYRHLKNNLQI